jgi:ElaB/YqjD/DUF883 family membrane-anchored ribosome-binding protein
VKKRSHSSFQQEKTMSTEKKAESTAERIELSERIARGAERMKEHESAALNAARDAVAKGSEHAERALHRATDATAEAARRTSERAARLNEQGQEQWARGRENAEQAMDRVFDYVRDNPGKSLAMALAGGWLIGSFLRRR